jgi:hypothetical protein
VRRLTIIILLVALLALTACQKKKHGVEVLRTLELTHAPVLLRTVGDGLAYPDGTIVLGLMKAAEFQSQQPRSDARVLALVDAYTKNWRAPEADEEKKLHEIDYIFAVPGLLNPDETPLADQLGDRMMLDPSVAPAQWVRMAGRQFEFKAEVSLAGDPEVIHKVYYRVLDAGISVLLQEAATLEVREY